MNEQKSLKQFAENMKMAFAVKELSIYKSGSKLFGSTLDGATIEKYLSLPCTTIYKGTGCKFVTRFNIGSDLYIMALCSDKPDTFDGLEAEYVISEIKKLIGKLGD
jgi:hypothetical protein